MTDNKKILALIEDDDVIRDIYSTVLKSEGFDVITASNGEEGLELVLKNDVNIIVLDMLMPDLTGVEFLKKYNPKAHQNVRIIGFSNLMDAQSMEQALELGADEYLLKSEYTPSKLAKFLKE